METLLLIDASALIYRFYHALPPLTTPDGEPIQGIYGLTNVLWKILRERKPAYAAAALARKEKTFRAEQFEAYKSHRPPAPNDLVIQLLKIRDVFAVFGIKTFDCAGFEADDVIGAFAERFGNEHNIKTLILSGDLDVLQLVRGNRVLAEIIKSGMENTEIYDEQKVEERYGLKPERLADYKGLVGDASDNIPGIKGIGPASAKQILLEFNSIESVYENIGLINPKIASKLEGKDKDALLYRSLATISKKIPIPMPSLDGLKIGTPDRNLLRNFFEHLGFTSLLKRLDAAI